MTAGYGQSELQLVRTPEAPVIPIELVRAKKTAAAAFTLACDCSGLEDKEIYLALGIDAGYFSNIKKGKATLQGDLIQAFCRIVGNRIYVEWLAYQVGCTLVQIQTEAERRAMAAEERARKAEERASILEEIIQRRVA